MTTTLQIITDAFRQSNLLAVGTSPTSPEQTEALRYLNRIVKSVFGHEVGEPLVAFPVGREGISRPAGYPFYDASTDADWFVHENSRLILNLDTSLDIYLHPAPRNGARFGVTDVAQSLTANPVTIYGNGNQIEGAASVTLSTDGTDSEWFYRDDIANWSKYAPLEVDDEFPFPEEFDDYFITMLAIRINPAYGTVLDGQSQLVMERANKQLKARYAQSRSIQSETALLRMSRMTVDRDVWSDSEWFYTPNSAFNKGWFR